MVKTNPKIKESPTLIKDVFYFLWIFRNKSCRRNWNIKFHQYKLWLYNNNEEKLKKMLALDGGKIWK